jgi:adenylate kinase
VGAYMDRGELVPDALTVRILEERIKRADCLKGFILDGYPRTIRQARELERLSGTDVVVLLNIPEDILVEKLSARRVCGKCGEIYNIADIRRTANGQTFDLPAMLPRLSGICDKCGGKLIQRKDDSKHVVRKRLEAYREQTEPLVKYYRDKGLVEDVYVTSGPDIMVPKIHEQLMRRVEKLQPDRN